MWIRSNLQKGISEVLTKFFDFTKLCRVLALPSLQNGSETMFLNYVIYLGFLLFEK